MFAIAIETELSSLASCAETHVMTRSGYQLITPENELFFVSKERFLNKYKGNLYLTPGVRDTLLSFDEACALRDAIIRLESKKLIKVKGSNQSKTFDTDDAAYHIVLPSSDVEIRAKRIRCEYRGNYSNVTINTERSELDVTASHAAFDITANDTAITMYVSNCFVELSGEHLDVIIIGSNNTVNGVCPGINVFSRGKKNEFNKRFETPAQDSPKPLG